MLTNNPTIRAIIYTLSITATITAIFTTLTNPELGKAFTTTAGILATTASTTALTNLNNKNKQP